MSGIRPTLIMKQAKCSCKGDNLDKLIQPILLTLLSKQELHGYRIIQEMENRNYFPGEKIDNTGVYRTLKGMEERALVRSRWDLEGSGPAKKIYCITEEGRICLGNWVGTLRTYMDTIGQIIEEAEIVLGQ